MEKKDILNTLSGHEALIILKQLAKEDGTLKKRISVLAKDLLKTVDTDDVCEDLKWNLDTIDVHDLWDSSGSTRYGYVDPSDQSFEMFDEALEPFLEELQRLIDLQMSEEAKKYRMGLLKGLYQWEKFSDTEFKDWAPDIARDKFDTLLEEWDNNTDSEQHKKEMNIFLKKECPDWY